MPNLLSNVILFLRFPLIIGVILIHSTGEGIMNQGEEIMKNAGILHQISTLIFSNILARTAVPLFFFIAGFLFFYKLKNFGFNEYKSNSYKRIKSLLIPYIIWNFIVIIIFYLKDLYFPQFTSGKHELMQNMSFKELLLCFWSYDNGGYPKCYQFWFIRDLMVVFFCLSPVIYWCIKKIKIFFVLLLGINWCFFEVVSFVGLSSAAMFFITLGAYFGINKIDFIELIQKHKTKLILLYSFISLIELVTTINGIQISYLHNINILIGMLAIFSFTSILVSKNIKMNSLCVRSTFFVYASHGVLLLIVQKLLAKLIPIDNDVIATIWYFSAGFLTTVLCIGLYFMSAKVLPKTTAIICGGRA